MKILTSILALSFFCAPLSGAADGFTTIFDGKDLSKIKTAGNWKIQNDESVGREWFVRGATNAHKTRWADTVLYILPQA